MALLYCTDVAPKEEMRSWKRQRRESETEATQGSEVWVRDLTQDGDVEHQPGPPAPADRNK